MLEIIDPGVLATIQDAGRPDAAPLGVPRAGACDPLALAAANLLLGDDPASPAIELSGGLPALRALEDGVLAVAGADLGLRIDGDGPWIRPGTSGRIRAGATIVATAAPRSGIRTYLAVPGGVAVPRVLGSASTCLAGAFGGLEGRRLAAGDVLRCGEPGRRTGAGHAWPGPGPSSGVTGDPAVIAIRVTDGPHRGTLGTVTEALLATDWHVSTASDRIGLRLEPSTDGPLATAHGRSLDSFGLAWGAIEVPPDGRPIVLLPDGPTVGGYPVPLVVAQADLPRLGQARPGDHIRFQSLSLEGARSELLAARSALAQARTTLAVQRSVW
jgi:antagonist of KipI